MERIRLSDMPLAAAAVLAIETLNAGGVILYPTETIYGLGADALSDDAVDRIYKIKARDLKKPIHALVLDQAMAGQFGELDERARALAALEPAVSIVVPRATSCTTGICRSIGSFGFRIASHPFCREVLRLFGRPITTTSANRAGRLPERSIDAILAQLDHTAQSIDFVIDGGELADAVPSTLVDLAHGEPEILREGTVPPEAIWAALGV